MSLLARNTYEVDEVLETPFNIKHLLRAWVYIKKYAGKMIGALIISAVAAATGLLSPIIVQRALDVAIPDKDEKQLVFLCVLLMGTYAISIVFATARLRIMNLVGQDIIHDIRNDLFEHLQELPFQYYDERPQGKILIRVVNYVNSVSEMLSSGIINIILEVLNLIFIVIFMFMVNVPLSFVVLAGVPFLAAVMSYIKKHQRISWQQVANKNSNLNAYLQEAITGVRVTQTFAREEVNERIFEGLSDKCRTVWMDAVKYSNLVWPGIDNVSVCIRAAIYLVGILVIGQGNVSIGTIVAMTTYAASFWQPIMNLGNIFNNFINNIANLERIFETMDEPVSIKDAEDAKDIGTIRGRVEFKDVSFSYEDEKNVLEHVSFTVEPGESVALVGPTGAGKSTIVNLISRFYDLNEGKIFIDGQDISKVTLKSLRSQMGIMMQDSFIFSGTIADNIRYGKLDATMEEIERASGIVHAHEFINSMEKGYETEVKERGNILSQGQRQLVSFARTLISDPRILILDEATSSIDVKTEKALQEGLDAMLKGRTSFIIAHRLSTIKNCDKIMFISDGRITECGSHKELMAKKGDYYKLYIAQ
ncbi:MAG: ABC transporter ATP-binding protein [Wujia sp.]